MEEVATCQCGNQKWTIYRDRIQCSKCGEVIEAKYLSPLVYDVNDKIRELYT